MSRSRRFEGMLLPVDNLFSAFENAVRTSILAAHLEIERAAKPGKVHRVPIRRVAQSVESALDVEEQYHPKLLFENVAVCSRTLRRSGFRGFDPC